MRIMLSGATLALMLASAGPSAAAYDGPWCAHRTLGRGFVENRCDMPSFEACRAEISASPGTWCTQNPYYRPPEMAPRRKAKRRAYRR